MKIESPLTITYEPIGQRVLLSCPEQEEAQGHVKERGVLVPAAFAKPQSAYLEMTVVAAGEKCIQVKSGDKVLFNPRNAGEEKPGDGFEYRWTEEQHIIAVVKKALKNGFPYPVDGPAPDNKL